MYNFLDNIIVKHLAGSRAYGTSTPESDTDYRGIFMAEKEFILTPFFNVNEVSNPDEEDTKFFELNNYMKLYLDGNPNIMETLWVDESSIVESAVLYDLLRSHRGELLSSKIAFTFTGYAHNQATRMKNHHGWMDKEREAQKVLQEIIDSVPCEQTKAWIEDNFPDYIFSQLNFNECTNRIAKGIINFEKYMKTHSIQMISTKPLKQYHFIKLVHNYFDHQVLERDFTILDYNNGYEMIPYGENIFAVVKREDGTCINEDGSIHHINTENRTLEEIKQKPCMIVKFNRDEYLKSSDNRKNYHKWKANRNTVRSQLEKKYGFDSKFASHVVRLLRMAEEVLTTGELLVKRPDAEELLAIRNGAWTYEQMIKFYEEKEKYIREVLYHKSVLPKTPDIKKAAKILIEMRELQYYGMKK